MKIFRQKPTQQILQYIIHSNWVSMWRCRKSEQEVYRKGYKEGGEEMSFIESNRLNWHVNETNKDNDPYLNGRKDEKPSVELINYNVKLDILRIYYLFIEKLRLLWWINEEPQKVFFLELRSQNTSSIKGPSIP